MSPRDFWGCSFNFSVAVFEGRMLRGISGVLGQDESLLSLPARVSADNGELSSLREGGGRAAEAPCLQLSERHWSPPG